MLAILLGLALDKRIAIKLTSVGHDDPLAMKARGSFAYWCYSRARIFFGVSPRFQVLYEGSGLPRERFRLIPNGVDLERFRSATVEERRALRGEIGLPVGARVTLFIGFFSREKCPDVLFEAWARSAPADPGSVLVFVGARHSTYYEIDRRMAEAVERRVVELGLAGRVVFVEATREIDKYQRAADVFVLPSVREGLPNALLEALACGTPCVATRLDGVTDVLIEDGVSGLLVPPRDEAALQSALERLAADPEGARAMGARGRERIARDYSASTMGRRYLAAYQELLAS
jgi:glycosyltransferase involved in cell wall biosynthesis